ncbi:MAG: hypothetical protein ABIJ22_03920, partial [Patescibacteria group bacterium]
MSFSNTLRLAINYLKNQQQLWGGFESWSSPTQKPFQSQHRYQTIFFNALILSALTNTTFTTSPTLDKALNKALDKIKNKLNRFLLTQKSPSYTWNYWTKNSPEHTRFSIPDDWDDTSCALTALYQHQPQLFTGKILAQITASLTTCESTPGGPYKTWLQNNSEPKWNNIDLAVNSNIAHFLSLLQVTLPNLVNFIDQRIVNSDYTSDYYPSVYPVLYFISRKYQGKHQPQLISKLLKLKTHQLWSTPLTTALSMSSLIRLGHTDKTLQKQTSSYLKKAQKPNGSWPAETFCYDPSIDHQPHYAGSPALTTALVIECLSLLESTQKPTITNQSQPHQRSIHQQINHQLNQLEPSLHSLAKPMVKKLIKADDDHFITTLPTHFYQAINKLTQTISATDLHQLGLANFWGWLAYSIYDDVMDQETNPKLITIANFAHREFILNYAQTMLSDSQFIQHLTQLMTQIDSAELKEITDCRGVVKKHLLTLPARLPDYTLLTQIADKSIGHALGPLAILYRLGYSRYDAPVQFLLEFMYHYLTARQLNDDIHDWEDDLKNGHLSPVVTQLIKTYFATSLTQSQLKINPTT